MMKNRIFKSCVVGVFMLFGILLPATSAWAHGGVSIKIDSCRIPIQDQWVHFTAYTPLVTADTEYCDKIPDVAAKTNLVFDYVGKKLRKLTIEFEITKEPEGTVVYHQDPKTHGTGTVNAVVDFTRYGAGDYLAHVTLISDSDKIDAHLPFTVGKGSGGSLGGVNLVIIVLLLGIVLAAVYSFVPGVKEKLAK